MKIEEGKNDGWGRGGRGERVRRVGDLATGRSCGLGRQARLAR